MTEWTPEARERLRLIALRRCNVEAVSQELSDDIRACLVELDRRAPHQPQQSAPIPMVLHCPACGLQHIDAPEDGEASEQTGFDPGWDNPPHRSHLCHGCGHIWRPADVPTEGVLAIKTRGKNDSPQQPASEEPSILSETAAQAHAEQKCWHGVSLTENCYQCDRDGPDPFRECSEKRIAEGDGAWWVDQQSVSEGKEPACDVPNGAGQSVNTPQGAGAAVRPHPAEKPDVSRLTAFASPEMLDAGEAEWSKIWGGGRAIRRDIICAVWSAMYSVAHINASREPGND